MIERGRVFVGAAARRFRHCSLLLLEKRFEMFRDTSSSIPFEMNDETGGGTRQIFSCYRHYTLSARKMEWAMNSMKSRKQEEKLHMREYTRAV